MFQAASEVENMKSQMMTLFKELQQAQSKLDEAEGMKKNLQDRSGAQTHGPISTTKIIRFYFCTT